MRILPLAAALLLPTIALAAPPPAQQPPPIVQACAATASEQMQAAILWHAQAIAEQAEIEKLRAPKAKPVPHHRAGAATAPLIERRTR